MFSKLVRETDSYTGYCQRPGSARYIYSNTLGVGLEPSHSSHHQFLKDCRQEDIHSSWWEDDGVRVLTFQHAVALKNAYFEETTSSTHQYTYRN